MHHHARAASKTSFALILLAVATVACSSAQPEKTIHWKALSPAPAGALSLKQALVSNKRLGLSVKIPRGSMSPKAPRNQIWVTGAFISALEVLPRTSVRKAEWRAALNLVVGPRRQALKREHMRVDGERALLIREVACCPDGSGPFPGAVVLFVYKSPPGTSAAPNRAVYSMALPGRTLSPRQRRLIASIRFVPRKGLFPCRPSMNVSPNPVRPGRKFSVSLSCVMPNHAYRFVAVPNRTGFGGGIMGLHRTGRYALTSFRYPVPTGSRTWTVSATDAVSKKSVARTVLYVRRH